jgi:Uma2 family endonuclease
MPEVLLRVGPNNAGERISAEKFASAEFIPPYRYERVKGRLAVMAPAGPDHRDTRRPFRRMLPYYWELHQDVIEDIDFEGWVATSDDDDRLPDICVYLKASASSQRVPDRVPDMIFEIVSESRSDQERDYIDKREEYHRIGVKEYVIVDRFKREVLVLTWKEGDYDERTLDENGRYTTPLLPGLAIELAEAFA